MVCATLLQPAAQQPLPLPNQGDVDRALNPKLPEYENPLEKRIREGLETVGLPPQPKLNPDSAGEEAPVVEPGLSESVLPRLDTNRDGFVSRSEYFSGRQRNTVAGSQGTSRALARQRRFDSRFRGADRNGDGKLSPTEIDAMKGRRF